MTVGMMMRYLMRRVYINQGQIDDVHHEVNSYGIALDNRRDLWRYDRIRRHTVHVGCGVKKGRVMPHTSNDSIRIQQTFGDKPVHRIEIELKP